MRGLLWGGANSEVMVGESGVGKGTVVVCR